MADVLHRRCWRLDNIIYDTRLRVTMPRTLDERIVIVDIDEKSLGVGPMARRGKMAALVRELFERQQVSVIGFGQFCLPRPTRVQVSTLQELAQGPCAAIRPSRSN